MTSRGTLGDDSIPDPRGHREPLPGAGVRIILLSAASPEDAERILAPVVNRLSVLNRVVETRVENPIETGLGRSIERGLESASLPLVLITTATEPWTPAHVDPLIAAIDLCDHVIGKRPAAGWAGACRWLFSLPRRLVFALPLLDIHSPCRLHRLEKLREFPLQSASFFVDTEILAKATYLGHVIDEVSVPPLAQLRGGRGWWRDCNEILSHPRFRRVLESGPTEDPQS
jgi:hypothetical protein